MSDANLLAEIVARTPVRMVDVTASAAAARIFAPGTLTILFSPDASMIAALERAVCTDDASAVAEVMASVQPAKVRAQDGGIVYYGGTALATGIELPREGIASFALPYAGTPLQDGRLEIVAREEGEVAHALAIAAAPALSELERVLSERFRHPAGKLRWETAPMAIWVAVTVGVVAIAATVWLLNKVAEQMVAEQRQACMGGRDPTEPPCPVEPTPTDLATLDGRSSATELLALRRRLILRHA